LIWVAWFGLLGLGVGSDMGLFFWVLYRVDTSFFSYGLGSIGLGWVNGLLVLLAGFGLV
jgi:hypothetical protein